jgi:hypothetical protein
MELELELELELESVCRSALSLPGKIINRQTDGWMSGWLYGWMMQVPGGTGVSLRKRNKRLWFSVRCDKMRRDACLLVKAVCLCIEQ